MKIWNKVSLVIVIALFGVACSNNKTGTAGGPDARRGNGTVDGSIYGSVREAGSDADDDQDGEADRGRDSVVRLDARGPAETDVEVSLSPDSPISTPLDADLDVPATNQNVDSRPDGGHVDQPGADAAPSCSNGCLIAGVCYPARVSQPNNPCLICDPARSNTDWSNNDGALCDDGRFCTVGDKCSSGSCAGSSRNCSDVIACNGVETCDEASDACVAGTGSCTGGSVCNASSGVCVAIAQCPGCVISGTCYGDGQSNPANPCQKCSRTTSASAWSNNDGALCDDGKFCTVGDKCSAGSCAGSARNCSDGIACNGGEICDEATDACVAGTSTCGGDSVCNASSGVCVAISTCPGCVIRGTCYGNGQANPANPCQKCSRTTSASAWSNNDGALCDDGKFCTVGDKCNAGACAGSARECSDGIACNGEETCDEDNNLCTTGTGTCTGGQVCDVKSKQCVAACTGCVIEGVCYGAGQVNPGNPCQACDTTASTTAWTNKGDGAACDDGKFCSKGDKCSAGKCESTTPTCDDGIACNGEETCDEDHDVCVAGATTCASNEICDVKAKQCVATCSGCVINKICYADGLTDPANPCQACATTASTTAWTNKGDGVACDDGRFCTKGDTCNAGKCESSTPTCDDGIACNGQETCDEDHDVCVAGTTTCASNEICDVKAKQCVATCSGCVINKICYADGLTDPANPCQTCDTTASTTAWTNKGDGVACDDGKFCTKGDRCNAGKCESSTPTCDDGIACNGQETCDEDHDLCVAGTTTCLTNTICNVATDQCVATCTGCLIGGTCYGAGQTNPGNPCEECPQNLSATAWSKKQDGASCDDSVFCNGVDTCSNGACGHGGSPCNGGTSCIETKKACYLVGVDMCNADGDVIRYNASGDPAVIHDCVAPDAHGTCVAGVCGCADGYSGADCQTQTTAPDCVVRVRPSGNDLNNGGTWAQALATVQAGLDLAVTKISGSVTACEVWVASGTYKPTMGTDRNVSFQLRANVALYGGFVGTETSRSQRDFANIPTVLSGDIGQTGVASDNSYHVVVGVTGGTIDGFTITAGNDNRVDSAKGAGMYNFNASPTVTNCTFSGNSAGGEGCIAYGGALYNEGSSPTLTNCTFSGNSAVSGGRNFVYAYGGALYNQGSSPRVTNCTFSGNTATAAGSVNTDGDAYAGAMYNFNSSPAVTNCIFYGNSALGLGPSTPHAYGGAMYNYKSSPRLANCTFSGNSASASSQAFYGAAGGAMYSSNSSPSVVNSILWGDSASGDANPRPSEIDGPATVSYSIVEGGAGTGTLSADPLFAPGTLYLRPTSPAIDQGTNCSATVPATDMEGKPRWDMAAVTNAAGTKGVDIGAFEYQGTAGIDTPLTAATCQ